MIDPCRAAVPTHPLCAMSIGPGRRHHRVGPDPYVVTSNGHRWELCSTACLFTWRAQHRRLWEGSRAAAVGSE